MRRAFADRSKYLGDPDFADVPTQALIDPAYNTVQAASIDTEMDDFSAKPGAPNGYGLIGGEANKIEARKRPLSSMSPVIVLKDGKAVLVTGSPGGSTIITSVLQMILNVIEWDMNMIYAAILTLVRLVIFAPRQAAIKRSFASSKT